MNIERIKKYIATIQKQVEDKEFQKKYRLGEHSFERQRKLRFEDIVYYTIGNLKTSLPEAAEYFSKYIPAETISGAALCKARQKISGKAFREIQEECAALDTRPKTYHNYHLIAVDGMEGDLPNTANFREEYQKTSIGKQPQFLAVSAYDILNEIFLMSEFHFGIGDERELAATLIKRSRERYADEKQIWIFDRGYPSVQMLKTLTDNDLAFVIRVSGSFLKEVNDFTKSKKTDETLSITLDKRRIATSRIAIDSEMAFELRCVRVPLKSGDEILITNLPKTEFPRRCLKKLYEYRWEIEVGFNYLKNSVYVEEFSSKTENGILQEFYSTLIMQNMITYVCTSFSPTEFEKGEISAQDQSTVCIKENLCGDV